MFCTYTWPRYQVSVYRTIGPLVINLAAILNFMSFCTYFNMSSIRPILVIGFSSETWSKTSMCMEMAIFVCEDILDALLNF